MSNVISLTVPRDDEAALVAGATMLLTLAGKVPAMELPEMRDPCAGCGGNPNQVEEIESFDPAPVAPPSPAQSPIAWPLRLPGEFVEPSTKAADGTPGDEKPDDVPLDADGLPWDARIHSGSKAILQDGTWRKKRGVDKADYDRVVEELKQLMAVPAVEVGPFYWIHPESESYGIEQTREGLDEVLAGDGLAQEADLEQYEAAAKMWATTDAPPPPPAPAPVPEQQDAVTPPPPPAPATDVPQTFPAFLKAITARIDAKELTIDQVNAALPEGVVNLQALGANRPDLIPSVWAKLP